MPIQTVTLVKDDFDGSDLPEGTEPIRLSLGRTTYALYLSEANHGKLMDALTPFIEGAETVSNAAAAPQRRRGGSEGSGGTVDTYGFPTADVRAWAQSEKVKQAKNGKPVGDKGRIPQDIYDAYKAAH